MAPSPEVASAPLPELVLPDPSEEEDEELEQSGRVLLKEASPDREPKPGPSRAGTLPSAPASSQPAATPLRSPDSSPEHRRESRRTTLTARRQSARLREREVARWGPGGADATDGD